MLKNLDRSPLFVFLFILFLAAPQLYAFTLQFTGGFVPFKHEPSRVHLSWDMFSTKIERCTLNWSPPITLGPAHLSSLRDASLPLEWDLTFDQPSDYRYIAEMACHMGGTSSTKANIKCFLQDGKIFNDEFLCKLGN
jgi:hypothetical protein